MLLHIQHQLLYAYSEPVTLEPHVLYLYPQQLPSLHVEQYQLTIEPQPSMLVCNKDVEGNIQHIAYYNKSTTNLSISMQATVRNTLVNPFDFIIYPFAAQTLPLNYDDVTKRLLGPHLLKEGVTLAIEQFARQIALKARWNTLQFLMELNRTIHENFVYEIRNEGAPKPADFTLKVRKGSCRDYVVLYMACCRTLGLAARFVSGYYFGNPDEEQYLHAWAEVYLPGSGWRGYDPTQNCMVANRHIALAASYMSEQVTPVLGKYWGQARSSLLTAVRVSEV